MSQRFPLDEARAKALEIAQVLGPHCERIEVAGSIRRGKPWVKDIDLVVIPKMTSKDALFGSTSELAETDFYAALSRQFVQTNSEGQRMIRGNVWLGAKLISIDVYIATPESWATLMLIRTGSAEHNIWMCARARACGGRLHADGTGLEVPGQYDPVLQKTVNSRVIRAKNEEEIFKALGIPPASPNERECANGRPLWMQAATA
jgi:DNA polymerase/3'-5' exonuclease PolX